MKYLVTLAVLSALLLAAFLIVRPRLGGLGSPTAPDTSGRARRPVPDGTISSATPETGTPGRAGSGLRSAPTEEEAARAGVKHPEAVERMILDLVNENRRREGKGSLKDLSWDDMLRDTARRHSDDMLLRGFNDHVNPDGAAPADRIARAHRRLVGMMGENIWWASGYDGADERKLAADIVKGWMESPGHRENILKPEYTHLGVGVSVKGDEVRATQNFAYVRALLEQPLPAQVRGGDTLQLATSPPADKYEYWKSDSGARVGDAHDIGDAVVSAAPGVYKLRFYFQSPSGFSIYAGPQVEVK